MAFSFPTIKEFLKHYLLIIHIALNTLNKLTKNFITDLLLQKNIIVQLYMKMIRSPL